MTEHRMERTYSLAATPEQVWDAIATAEGIASWMAPTQIDPRVGGEVSFDLGGFVSTGVITGYTPLERIAYEEPWPIAEEMSGWFDSVGIPLSKAREDVRSAGPIATEFLIESASGGSCVLRVVTSAFGSGADWENEFFAHAAGGFFELLDKLAAQLGGPR